MRVHVKYDGLKDLQRDLEKGAPTLVREGRKLVAKKVREGSGAARRIAREKSGPHGKAYYKRITSDMTGPMTGEWGPHDGGTPVGAGWRNGPGNTDLPQSADIIVPQFQKDAADLVASLFWPGAK